MTLTSPTPVQVYSLALNPVTFYPCTRHVDYPKPTSTLPLSMQPKYTHHEARSRSTTPGLIQPHDSTKRFLRERTAQLAPACRNLLHRPIGLEALPTRR